MHLSHKIINMKKSLKTIAAFLAVSSLAPTPVIGQKVENRTEINQSLKKEGIIQKKEKKGQGIVLSYTGGLDFDYPAMFKHSTPFFDPKRPHPIESYRSQQRKAKQRNKSKKYA